MMSEEYIRGLYDDINREQVRYSIYTFNLFVKGRISPLFVEGKLTKSIELLKHTW